MTIKTLSSIGGAVIPTSPGVVRTHEEIDRFVTALERGDLELDPSYETAGRLARLVDDLEADMLWLQTMLVAVRDELGQTLLAVRDDEIAVAVAHG